MNVCAVTKAKATILGLFLFLAVYTHAQPQPVKPYLRIETGTHSGAVQSISVDAAEKFLVSASDDKTARVWDLRTGNLLKILRPPIGDFIEGMLYAVAISPDGTTIALGGLTGAAASSNFPIYIFDRESGIMRKKISGLPQVVNYLAYSKDGRYLAAALARKNGIRVFETAGYSEVARDTNYEDDIYDVEFDQSGRLAAASWDGFVRLYDPQFRLLHKERPHGGKQPRTARFSHDGKRLVVGFSDTLAVDILSADDLLAQRTLKPPHPEGGNVSKTTWSVDGNTVCAAGSHANDSVFPILCWGNQGKDKPGSFPAAGNTILDIHALSDGSIAFCAGEGSVGVLDRNGRIHWRSAFGAPDYNFTSSILKVSSDGDNVEIAGSYLNGTSWTHHILRFSVSERMLQVDAPPEAALLRPTTVGLNIEGWENGYHPTLDGHALELEQHETSRSLAISPNRDNFILGTEWYIRKFDNKGKQLWQTSVQGVAWRVNISADRRYVVAALNDGTIRWYTFDQGQEVLALFVDSELHRWVAWDPGGFFASDGGGDALIGYHLNRGPDQAGEFVKVDQLRDVFYRPDLLAGILKPGGAESMASARKHIGDDIAGILSGGPPPEIELISPAQQEVADEYLLQFRIKASDGRHGRIVYRIDGAEIEGRGATDVRGTGSDTIGRYIPVGSGIHTVAVTVYSANGKVESQPKVAQISRRQPTVGPSLYVIAAGVSHYSDHALWDGVRFASADADLVAKRFQEQEGLGLYRKVTTVPLSDRQATAKNIQDEIARAAKAVQPGDTFILYLAGHGVAQDGEYYFIPWEAEYTNREQWLGKSLNREAIQALLKQIPTNKSVLILDTCSAGTFLGTSRGDAGEKAAVEKVSLMSGRAVLAASNSNDMAMDGYQNHGVFTYALLQGLEQADVNAQGEILISRLAEFVQSRVPVLTDEKWHYRQLPLSRIEGEPFPIAHKHAH